MELDSRQQVTEQTLLRATELSEHKNYCVGENLAPLRILILDDQPEAAELVARDLHKASSHYVVRQISDITCMPSALEQDYDLVFLDLHLGPINGLELIRDSISGLPKFPIILLTNDENPAAQEAALELGVADFILKRDITPALLKKSVRYCSNLFRQYRLKEQMTAMERALSVDPFSGLNTAAYCFHRINTLLAETRGRDISVLACQIHNISTIGRGVGIQRETEIIQQYSRWLKQHTPNHYVIGCTKDYQLLVVVPDLDRVETLNLCKSLSQQILELDMDDGSAPFTLAHFIGAVHHLGGQQSSAQKLTQKALVALQYAKSERHGCELYSPDLHKHVARRAIIVQDITRAINNHEIHFEVQPQYSLKDAKLIGGEMLMRWRHQKLGLVNPETVVEVAEATQQIGALGSYALQTALKTIEDWLAKDYLRSGFRLAVNVSAAELESEAYFEIAAHELATHAKAAKYLELEITESVKLLDPLGTSDALMRLRKYGVHIAIDDFGTAHANIGQLCYIQADVVKLDKSIVYAADQQHRARSIYRSIRRMLHGLGTKIIAEGIETPEQLKLARDTGIDIVQGFLLSRPTPIVDFEELLQDQDTLQQAHIAKFFDGKAEPNNSKLIALR